MPTQNSAHFVQRVILSVVASMVPCCVAAAEAAPEAARGIVERLVPSKADQFAFATIPQENGSDVFEIESRDGKIVIRGSTGVAMAAGWNWYLNHYCHCQVSFCGNNLALPDPLPLVKEKIRLASRVRYRYYLNFCAFSYSLAWWDWPQWERLIDWMALHGINMPLSVTGEEAIWQKVYRKLGLSDEEIGKFFAGPGYLPFGWMGCMDSWAGPLPQDWIDRHLALQKKIVAREMSLGMTPVLQGFTGHVPEALTKVFPDAKLLQPSAWQGFPATGFLDPQDPRFVQIGKMFIEEQTRQFGTAHLYASDTFIEMWPPSNDPKFLATVSKSVYEAMRAGDPEAVWVMQGWIFVTQPPPFWKPPQAKAYLQAVPDNRMILLDLLAEALPVWDTTEAFYGKPWIWCIVHNYGSKVELRCNLPQIVGSFQKATVSSKRGRLEGIGMVNEGLGYSPVVSDLLYELPWRATDTSELRSWMCDFVQSRYGSRPAAAEEAWQRLMKTHDRIGNGSVIGMRPSFDDKAGYAFAGQDAGDGSAMPAPHYAELVQVWRKLLDCSGELGNIDTYRFDLVTVNRQVLSNLAFQFRKDVVSAYQRKDRQALDVASARFLQLIRDMDELLATREELLLGKWLADAKRWATNDEQRQLYEWNARNIITLWGPRNSPLHDYANKQWSGMLTGFYLPRWELFFTQLDKSLAHNRPFDASAYETKVRLWEEEWTHGHDEYPTTVQGDAVAISRRLYDRYGAVCKP